MVACVQSVTNTFWHGGTRSTFAKARWREILAPNPWLIWGWGHVFSQDEDRARWFPECLVWCVQQWGASTNQIIDATTPSEELEWEPMFLPSSYHHAAGQEGKEGCGNGNYKSLDRLAVQTSEPSESCLPSSHPKTIDWRFDSFILWDTELGLPAWYPIFC